MADFIDQVVKTNTSAGTSETFKIRDVRIDPNAASADKNFLIYDSSLGYYKPCESVMEVNTSTHTLKLGWK